MVEMSFRIQASMPKNNSIFYSEDAKLSEAIETIFPMMTEDAFIILNTIYIPLNYKYDVSCMIEDILIMLSRIRKDQSNGNLEINWPSNTFACKWELQWNEGLLCINSNWNTVSGHTVQMLNEKNNIKTSIIEFLSEWKMLLEVLIKNLDECGYNEENLRDMCSLLSEYRHIEELGMLYK